VATPVVPTRALHYAFKIDEKLTTLEAELCFDGAPPASLVCGVGWGVDYLKGAFTDATAVPRALPTSPQGVELAGLGGGQCVRYIVDLSAASGGFGGLDAMRRGAALVSNIAVWLWRPPNWADIPAADATFSLPDGMRVSVPWPREGDRYVLDRTAFAFFAHAAFGRFEVEHLQAPGVAIEVAILDGLTPATREAVVPWLKSAAQMASLLSGSFPRDRAQVVVVPTAPSDEPVRFGMMTRGGGASVGVLLPSSAQLEPMRHDWVALHEFTHLYAPFIARDGAWLSEGLATYYQEVLRVRGGKLPAAAAWKRIYAGSQQRRNAKLSLAEESAHAYQTWNFSMVYWAGAAFALMADVELRRASYGTRSLDDLMIELTKSCANDSRPYSAQEVLDHMDRIAGTPIMAALQRRWVMGPNLPELTQLYAQLGIEVAADGSTTSVPAEHAWIRDAIMRVQTPSSDASPP
jgi:hypothetical protein